MTDERSREEKKGKRELREKKGLTQQLTITLPHWMSSDRQGK